MALRVAIIQGGPSAEAEVSRASATAVATALRASGHECVQLELQSNLAMELARAKCDVAFPLAHGTMGEDGTLAGFLEVVRMPYVGSGVLAGALAMHKAAARLMFEQEGLPIAKGLSAKIGESPARLLERIEAQIGARFVVKPASSGSALGVSRIDLSQGEEAARTAFEIAWKASDTLVVESWVEGREITCGVLDNAVRTLAVGGESRGAFALPPTEIDAPEDAFYTFQARYANGRSVHRCPAPLHDATLRRVQEVALRAHEALGCRDLSRADFIVNDSGADPRLVLLEVNTLPGFTATSLYPEAAAVAGIPLGALVSALVENAFQRKMASPVYDAVPLPT